MQFRCFVFVLAAFLLTCAFRYPPVTAIVGVKYDDAAGSSRPFRRRSIELLRPATRRRGWLSQSGAAWPSAWFDAEMVRVRFTAGLAR